jgi:FtsH-binding integral membrane protein
MVSCILGILGMPPIVIAKDVSAYREFIGMYFGLMVVGDHAAGWAVLLSGWAALKTRSPSRIFCCFSVLVGIVFLIEFAAKPLMPIGLFLSIIWGAWLGVVLLRRKT